jgi:carbonic anhydrase
MKQLLNKSFLCLSVLLLGVIGTVQAGSKPSPDEAVALLQAGNARFIAGASEHPHTDAARIIQAGKENQGDHAYATVITCSDSRVPVERVFDAGVMDLFIIRVAGNVCDTDEVGSIEYGLAHVNTPVLVVLGHTQCGVVTAVTHAVHGKGHALERNIPPLVDNIQPAVERAMHAHQDIHGDAIIPYAIKENVWQGIEDLYLASPSTRALVKSGKAKVVGAIYDVGTGKIEWLPEAPSLQILAKVEANPNKALNAMADAGHGSQDSHPGAASHESVPAAHAAPAHGTETTAHASAGSHGSGHDAGSHHTAIAVHAEKVSLIAPSRLQSLDTARHREINVNYAGVAAEAEGLSLLWKIAGIGVVVLIVLGLAWQAGVFQRMGIAGKLYTGFGAVVLIAVVSGVGGYYFLSEVNAEAHLEAAALELDMMAGEVSKVLDEIVGSVGKTTDLVSEIAAASQEQATGIDQVNTAVSQMDKVTQQNAASAEESASASEELSAQAESMNQAVQELVALVGGRNGSSAGQTGCTTGLARPAQASHDVYHQIAQRIPDRHRSLKAKATAQQEIPLEDDRGMDDFNN